MKKRREKRYEEEVLGLEVAVDDAGLVQVDEGRGDLRGVELHALFRELKIWSEMKAQRKIHQKSGKKVKMKEL